MPEDPQSVIESEFPRLNFGHSFMGRLHYSRWDDNGTPRYGVEIISETIDFF